jgi:aryl-alcohol dehydrogenase-like predicted oxidoreductase
MLTRRLGRTGLEISVVGFGAWQIGGTGVAGGSMGPADDGESIAAIQRAVELGVTWIDTAPGYGLGHSEEVVGRALATMPPADRPLVFTKCAFVWDEAGNISVCLRPESLRAECEASLRRLGVEALDLLQIHWLEPEDDPLLEEAWATLLALRAEGSVRHVGVSNLTVDQLERCQALGPVETLQPLYNLLDRTAEDALLPWCAQHDTGVLVYSPMASGLLTGGMTAARIRSLPADDARRQDPVFMPPRVEHSLAVADRLVAAAGALGRAPGRLAVEWTLGHPAVTAAIVGLRRPAQADEILGAGIEPLAEAERERLAAVAQSSAGGP